MTNLGSLAGISGFSTPSPADFPADHPATQTSQNARCPQAPGVLILPPFSAVTHPNETDAHSETTESSVPSPRRVWIFSPGRTSPALRKTRPSPSVVML